MIIKSSHGFHLGNFPLKTYIVNSLTLLSLCAILSACGFKFFVIPNLDWLVTNKINKSLHLKASSKERLRKDVATLLENSKPQFQRIKKHLENYQLQSFDIYKESKFFEKEYSLIVHSFTPIFAKYLSEMNGKQIEKFKKFNAETNQELLEEKKNTGEKIFERYQRFLGELTIEQKNLIRSKLNLHREIKEGRITRRLKYQQSLYEILNLKDSIEKREKISKVTIDYNKFNTESSHRRESFELIMKIIKISTPKQAEHFREKIEDYIPWIDSYLDEDFV